MTLQRSIIKYETVNFMIGREVILTVNHYTNMAKFASSGLGSTVNIYH